MNSQPIIKLAIALTLVIQAVVSIPLAEAGCFPTGTRLNGKVVLRCTPGKPSCCRDTGRRRTVRGQTYKIMDCSRCR